MQNKKRHSMKPWKQNPLVMSEDGHGRRRFGVHQYWMLSRSFLLGLVVLGVVQGSVRAASPEIGAGGESLLAPSPEVVDWGASLYQDHCARCHGVQGEGNGELAADLNPRPTNFASGVYKFRSTESGSLPTDADLLRTLSVGVLGTSMPDFQDLSVSDRQVLVGFLKTLSPRFKSEPIPAPLQFPETSEVTPEAIKRGKLVFSNMQCAACHGNSGRGDGPLAKALHDSSGDPILPANLTKAPLKSGKSPSDIFRTVMTGLDGTPMPSYGDSLSPQEGWDLALFVFSFRQRGGEK